MTMGIALERRLEDLGAADARQAQVREQDVEGELGELLESELSARGLLHGESVLDEALRHDLPQRVLVVHEQQMLWRISHLAGRRYFDTEMPL
jgi:hypothetical protein